MTSLPSTTSHVSFKFRRYCTGFRPDSPLNLLSRRMPASICVPFLRHSRIFGYKKSRVTEYLRYFGNPAVCMRPCRLSAPPSRVVKYYRLSCAATADVEMLGSVYGIQSAMSK
jgi:hypothetical protein